MNFRSGNVILSRILVCLARMLASPEIYLTSFMMRCMAQAVFAKVTKLDPSLSGYIYQKPGKRRYQRVSLCNTGIHAVRSLVPALEPLELMSWIKRQGYSVVPRD